MAQQLRVLTDVSHSVFNKIMLRELLIRLNPDAFFVPLDSTVVDFLDTLRTPEWLMFEINQICASTELTIPNHIVFPPMNSLMQFNDGEPWGAFSRSGYLSLAYGISGDQIAVEMASKKMVYISHDELWEFFAESGTSVLPDVRTRMVTSEMIFGDFWLEASLNPEFPCDFYEAVDRWGRYPL